MVMKKLEEIERIVDQIVYAFYRYEIKSGMNKLDLLIPEMSGLMTKEPMSGSRRLEYNPLLEMLATAVEKKDYLIAADLLKYELLKRLKSTFGPAGIGETI
ncbi:hypothetical protein [Paenibacillus humicola]|uniref:hypothetical protein n=1 Tax=Paenibacillus humicola TaxID=3110540 RepID=UPI00237A1CFC|nr:hypothetical protein [Paenibacillus humicola]